MNLFKDKETQKGLILSLIGSAIFLAFIQPIMLFLWEIIQKLSSTFFYGFIDSTYSNAALGQRNWIDFLIWTSIVLFAFNFIIKTMLKAKEVVEKVERKEKINSLNENEALDYLKNEQSNLKNKISKLTTILKWSTKLNWLTIPLSIIPLILILFMSYTDLQLNASFNQRINAISPYVNESEIKILKSKWALMKNRRDFVELNNYMEMLAKKNSCVLPNNLLD